MEASRQIDFYALLFVALPTMATQIWERGGAIKKGGPLGPPFLMALLSVFRYWAATQALASSRLSVPSYSALPLTAPTKLVVRVRG